VRICDAYSHLSSFRDHQTHHFSRGKGEGGPGVLPKAVKFQMRPNPLAK
jgi:hypothetical protein